MSLICASSWNGLSCRAIGWIVLAAILAGCQVFDAEFPVAGSSPLQPARQSPGSVALEIYWARYPLHDEQLDQAIWNKVDETPIDARVRRRLESSAA